MKISFHSFSDVITNSSEVIYVTVGKKTIELVKELINYFLENAGSEKRADDLFKFSTELDDGYVDRILDNIDAGEEELLPEDALELHRKDIKEEERHKIVRRLVDEGKIDASKYDNDYGYREDSVIITPKDNRYSKEALNITGWIRSAFDLEATRDG